MQGNSKRLQKLKASAMSSFQGLINISISIQYQFREWLSPATVTWMLRELVENDKDHEYLTNKFDWYFLPIHNPDGYEFSRQSVRARLWRKNRSAVGGPHSWCKVNSI